MTRPRGSIFRALPVALVVGGGPGAVLGFAPGWIDAAILCSVLALAGVSWFFRYAAAAAAHTWGRPRSDGDFDSEDG